MPITGLAGIQATLQQAATTGKATLQKQMQAEMEKSARVIAAASPRTRIAHPHLQDTYSVEANGASVDLVNSRPYTRAVFEAQRKNPDAQARQQKLKAATQAEAARLAGPAFDAAAVVVEQKLGKP